MQNILATEKLGKLIFKFSLPTIISFLVTAIYNIVDQIYIGNSHLGMNGVAATNISFPLVTICATIALLFGIGGASNFSLFMGKGEKERAAFIVGNSIFFVTISSIILMLISLVFLKPILIAFGATETLMPLAFIYTQTICIGIPFTIFTTAAGMLIRSDGKPLYSMLCMVSGAVFNIIFDPIFLYVFDMGIFGIALATILGQMLTASIALYYFFKKFSSVKLERKYFKPSKENLFAIVSLGMAASFNQLAMTIVQITLNNTLKHYGAQSIYGSEIPLACVGAISKINILYMSFTLGIAQGCQPISGFNYGAKNYERVKQCYKIAASSATLISCFAFLLFQIFPIQIASIFGGGSNEYFEFSKKYLQIFMLMTPLNGFQPITSNFFTSIGKAKMGIFISMTRQVIFLLPLILFLPVIFGIDGVLFAGPIADFISAIFAILLVIREMKILDKLKLIEYPSNVVGEH